MQIFDRRFFHSPDITEKVVGFVMDNLPAGISEELAFRIRLCVEEAAQNINIHSISPWIRVTLTLDGGPIEIELIDSGVRFNPLESPEYDVNAPLEDRPIGGLGIFLCKKMCPSIGYAYENGTNILKMNF